MGENLYLYLFDRPFQSMDLKSCFLEYDENSRCVNETSDLRCFYPLPILLARVP